LCNCTLASVPLWSPHKSRLNTVLQVAAILLQVPGLAEARPSVLRGDALYVSRADGTDGGKEWQGVVHIVRREEVRLQD
jgi:hypothetical protein